MAETHRCRRGKSTFWNLLIIAIVGAAVGPVLTVLLTRDPQGNPPPPAVPPGQKAEPVPSPIPVVSPTPPSTHPGTPPSARQTTGRDLVGIAGPPLTPEEAAKEAAKRVDPVCSVQMRVSHTKMTEFSLLLNSKKYKEPGNFTVLINKSVLADLKQIGADDPERYFFGKTIVVAGTVSLYEGQPEIKVYKADQIREIRKSR